MTIENTIRNIITENVEGFDGQLLSADVPFLDAGLDSLDLATILLEVQEELEVTLEDGQDDQYDSLSKLIAYIESAKAG